MLGFIRRSSRGASIIESAQNNDVQNVKMVVKQTKRKSLTECDSSGCTALHVAAREGHGGMVEMLLGMKADTNKRDNNGKTPLHYACESNKPQSIDIIRSLLTIGEAHVTALTNDGFSPLHYFIKSSQRESSQFVDTIIFMIKKGVNVNSQNNNGETALHIAAAQGMLAVVDFLLQQGVEIDRRTKDGETALHIAVRCDHMNIAKLLLQKGSDPKIQSNNGTVLEYCSRSSTPEARALIEEASYAQQARLLRERSPFMNRSGSLQIDLDLVKSLEKKGYQSVEIMAAIYTLHTSNMPIDNEQMILNELMNGNHTKDKECSVCMDNDINCVLYPCGHATMCLQCAEECNVIQGECPICRSHVEKALRIFHE